MTQFKCLCCDQIVTAPRRCANPEAAWGMLKLLGFTREELLTTHLANIDFTASGFSDWLREHPDG